MRYYYSKKIAWQKIDDIVVVTNELNGSMHKIDGTGSIIWNEIGSNSSFEEILSSLIRIYKLEDNIPEVRIDIEIFITELIEKELIYCLE